MRLSIVTTMYRSQPYLRDFHARVSRVAQAITADYEIVLVNDGSPDDSLALALQLHAEDPCVKVVDLSRNFGHHKAIMTGLEHTTGDLVFFLDCDLEIAPETLAAFHDAWQAEAGAVDVVYGVLAERDGAGPLEIAFGRLFYTLFNTLSEYRIPVNITTARLMTRRYVAELLKHREQQFIIAGLWTLTGFRQVPITVEKPYKGSSTYNLRRKLWIIIHAVTSFSSKPLVAIAGLGMLITIPSAFYIVFLVARYLLGGIGVDGYTSLIVSIWFLGGLVIFILGVIAIYLSVIFLEVKNRPYTVVRQVYSRDREHGPSHNGTATPAQIEEPASKPL